MPVCDLYFFEPGEVRPGLLPRPRPLLILECTIPERDWGANGVFLRDWTASAGAALLPSGQRIDLGGCPVAFGHVLPEQRHAGVETLGHCAELLRRKGAGADAADALLTVEPTVLGVRNAADIALHHIGARSEFGALFWLYATETLSDPASFEAHNHALTRGECSLAPQATRLNHGSGYQKWRSDLELERKFTFRALPDTWSLIVDLHAEIVSGGMGKWVPESGMGFQVFDYDSHVFDVTAPPDEAGYISFIPQSNDLMIIKRKWFQENSEIRREKMVCDLPIGIGDIEDKARTLTPGTIKRLPEFRRVRFDVNFESLETGHIFGIYFDICRSAEYPEFVFGQCEVEYCRCRTLLGMKDHFREYEQVCGYTADFLTRRGVQFQHDLFSKLDFARSIDTSAREYVHG